MFHASGHDVLAQAGMVIKVLFPIYAIMFGLVAAQHLIDIAKKALMPPKPKKSSKSSSRPKRSSIYVASDRNPKTRRTKKGLYVYYE